MLCEYVGAIGHLQQINVSSITAFSAVPSPPFSDITNKKKGVADKNTNSAEVKTNNKQKNSKEAGTCDIRRDTARTQHHA